MNAIRVNPLPQQVVSGRFFSGKQQFRNLIRQYPVDLLGHGAIPTAQPCFHMNHRNTFFHGDQRTGNGGIHVAHHQYCMGQLIIEDRLKTFHDICRLCGMGAGSHLEINIGLGDMQLLKEGCLHGGIVMLPGMNQLARKARLRVI